MPTTTTPTRHHPVLIERADGFYFHVEELALIGSGPTIEAAHADFKRRYDELEAMAKRADIADALPLTTARPTTRSGGGGEITVKGDLKTFVIKVLIVAGVILGMMLPVALTVSSAIDRAIAKSRVKGGRDFWANLEKGLKDFAEAKDADPERQRALIESLRGAVARVSPFTRELAPLFEGPNCPVPSATPTENPTKP